MGKQVESEGGMMGLSCDCGGGDYAWWYEPPDDYCKLTTKRRRRCFSCKELIDIGATAAKFDRWREYRNDIEWRIYGDDVPLSPEYFCEECADLFFSLDELGFCITLTEGESMKDLVSEYHEFYGPPEQQP
jgi:hypothetical protein